MGILLGLSLSIFFIVFLLETWFSAVFSKALSIFGLPISGEIVEKLGKEIIKKKYGNLFQMYEKIVDEDPYVMPMKIYPAVHYTMGGVWVDYNLMTTIPGCFAIGEANFSDHGANRLGASALMQGLADGYFVPVSYTHLTLPTKA